MKTIIAALILIITTAGCATRSPEESALIRRQLDERIALREKERATLPQNQSLAAQYEKNLLAQDAEKARLAEKQNVYAHEDEAARDLRIAKFKEGQAQKDKDMDVCRYEATKATASAQRGYTLYSTIFNDVGDTFKQAELIGLCMKSKGYA